MDHTQPKTARRRVAYVASERLAKVSSLLPSNRNRAALVHSLMMSLGLLRPAVSSDVAFELLRPSLATEKELSTYHSKDYVEFLLTSREGSEDVSCVESGELFGLEDDCPPFRGLSEYVRAVAGAALAGAQALARDEKDISICWDGGRHHAHKSHASGFCYVNDCILALLYLKRAPCSPSATGLGSPRKPRIMYLDLDLHLSDAVSAAFHTPSSTSSSVPQILTLSVHHAAPGFFPVSSLAALPDPSDPLFDPFTLAVPLRAGASCATFARVWVSVVEKVKASFSPDYVVIQCGVDGLAGDPCKVWNWAIGGEGGMGWCIKRVVSDWNHKVLLLGGGGYNSPNAARAWAYLTSMARGEELSLETPIPDHGAFPAYAPSFTLDVPPGNARDQNSDEYLSHIEGVYEEITRSIRQRVQS